MMLEQLSTRVGPIVKYNGKAISSVINPVFEAERWVASQDFCDFDQIIVLGVGCGYHLKTLAENNPNTKIVAIDNSLEMIRFVNEYSLKGQKNLDLIHAVSGDETLDILENFMNLKETFKVLEFRARTVHDKELFEEVRDALLGQTLTSAKKYLSLHGINCVLPKSKHLGIANEQVHLKKLLKTVHVESLASEESRQVLLLARSLGEMIA